MKMEKKHKRKKKKKEEEKKENSKRRIRTRFFYIQAFLWLFFNISTEILERKDNKKEKKNFQRCYRNV